MFPGMPMGAVSADAKRLDKILKQLTPSERESLLAFADFLLARANSADRSAAPAQIQQPQGIIRPDEESVIAAVKRLRQNYAMVNSDALLHETSELVQSHLLKGRPSSQVIDELEQLFDAKYKEYAASTQGDSA